MTPRLIYKWKSFWLGLFVLTSLAVAWIRSYNYRDEALLDLAPWGPCIKIGHDSSAITFEWWPSFGRARFRADSIEIRSGYQWFPSSSSFYREAAGRTEISLAYWFVIPLVFLTWLTFLAWRRRKIRILAKSEAEAAADAQTQAASVSFH